MQKNHPFMNAVARGAALALGYYGTKLIIQTIDDWRKHPENRPFTVTVKINKKED